MKLNIFSPERKLLEGQEIDEVLLTGSEGQIQILPGHAPILGILETGLFQYRSADGTAHSGMISSGFFEVKGNEVNVMAETLELEGEIDLERAKKAQRQAEEVLREADLDEHRFRKYQLKLQRSLIRQQIVSKEHS